MIKNKLFTHTDLDGIGCAILAKLAFGENIDISYCDHDNIDKEVNDFLLSNKDFNACYITDIKVNDFVAKLINDNYKSVYLMDHHPTALYLDKYDWCTIKIEDENTKIKTSGTELYYQWLINNGYLKQSKSLDKFVETVRDYDTWRWNVLGEEGVICKRINDLMYLYGKDEFIKWCLFEIRDDVFPKLHIVDEIVLDIKQKEINQYIEEKNETLFEAEICGRKCGIVFAEKYVSELGNKLCKLHPEIDFVAMIDINNSTVSYRSIRDDIKLGEDIASKFGGGGHPQAAGSSFNEDIKKIIVEHIFKDNIVLDKEIKEESISIDDLIKNANQKTSKTKTHKQNKIEEVQR